MTGPVPLVGTVDLADLADLADLGAASGLGGLVFQSANHSRRSDTLLPVS